MSVARRHGVGRCQYRNLKRSSKAIEYDERNNWNRVTACRRKAAIELTRTSDTAHNTRTEPSRTRNARSTYIVKSTCPSWDQTSINGT